VRFVDFPSWERRRLNEVNWVKWRRGGGGGRGRLALASSSWLGKQRSEEKIRSKGVDESRRAVGREGRSFLIFSSSSSSSSSSSFTTSCPLVSGCTLLVDAMLRRHVELGFYPLSRTRERGIEWPQWSRQAGVGNISSAEGPLPPVLPPPAHLYQRTLSSRSRAELFRKARKLRAIESLSNSDTHPVKVCQGLPRFGKVGFRSAEAPI
jgi:hypothetical protein